MNEKKVLSDTNKNKICLGSNDRFGLKDYLRFSSILR